MRAFAEKNGDSSAKLEVDLRQSHKRIADLSNEISQLTEQVCLSLIKLFGSLTSDINISASLFQVFIIEGGSLLLVNVQFR